MVFQKGGCEAQKYFWNFWKTYFLFFLFFEIPRAATCTDYFFATPTSFLWLKRWYNYNKTHSQTSLSLSLPPSPSLSFPISLSISLILSLPFSLPLSLHFLLAMGNIHVNLLAAFSEPDVTSWKTVGGIFTNTRKRLSFSHFLFPILFSFKSFIYKVNFCTKKPFIEIL